MNIEVKLVSNDRSLNLRSVTISNKPLSIISGMSQSWYFMYSDIGNLRFIIRDALHDHWTQLNDNRN